MTKETYKGLDKLMPHLVMPSINECMDKLFKIRANRAALFQKYKKAFGEFQEQRRQEEEAMQQLERAYKNGRGK